MKITIDINELNTLVRLRYYDAKMRTCKFEVIVECENIRTEELDGYGYGELDDQDTYPEVEECSAFACENSAEDCEDHCQGCEAERDAGAHFCYNCGDDFN